MFWSLEVVDMDLTCEKVCQDCETLDKCPVLLALKNYPDGANAQQIARDTRLPLDQVKTILWNLCLLSCFALK